MVGLPAWRRQSRRCFGLGPLAGKTGKRPCARVGENDFSLTPKDRRKPPVDTRRRRAQPPWALLRRPRPPVARAASARPCGGPVGLPARRGPPRPPGAAAPASCRVGAAASTGRIHAARFILSYLCTRENPRVSQGFRVVFAQQALGALSEFWYTGAASSGFDGASRAGSRVPRESLRFLCKRNTPCPL
jgi:hypothetical protein